MPARQSPDLVEVRAKDAHYTRVRVLRAPHSAAPVIVCLPALGLTALRYDRFAGQLQRTGWNVVISDLRGFGGSSVRPARDNDFGYTEIVHRDLPALLTMTRRLFPDSIHLLFGHGLGGQLWALYLSQYPSAAALATIGAANGHYRGWPLSAQFGLVAAALTLRPVAALLGVMPTRRTGLAGNTARTVVRDWSHNCLSGHYRLANDRANYELDLEKLRKPVLMMSIEGDRLAPRDAVDGLATKMFRSSPSRRHLSAKDLAIERPDHVNWLRRPDAIVHLLNDWYPDAVRPASLDRTIRTPSHRVRLRVVT